MIDLKIKASRKWVRYFHKACALWVEANLSGRSIGGNGIVTEMDESNFHKMKYNQGRHRPEQWVFGLVERHRKMRRFWVVPDRSQRTLSPIIVQHVKAGATVYSDGWRAYSNLRETYGFNHIAIDHHRYFVHPDDPEVHTECMESVWKHAKDFCGRNGGWKSLQHLQDKLDAFSFRSLLFDGPHNLQIMGEVLAEFGNEAKRIIDDQYAY